MTLDKILATVKVVESNTLGRHWTMRGDNFMANHPYFDEITNTLRDLLDYVAEAIGRKGNIPVHTLTRALELSDVEEETIIPSMRQMLLNESADLKVIVGQIFAGVRDNNFTPSEESRLTDFSDRLESHAYWIDQTTESWGAVPTL